MLKRLDLASLQIGLPTPAQGFIDLDMKTIVSESGLGQRRCERAIAALKEAGFVTVKQPRRRNEEGAYIGLRAIRLFTEKFFDWLGLLPMLRRERDRASQALRKRAARLGKSVSDFMGRLVKILKPVAARPRRSMDVEKIRAWNHYYIALTESLETREDQRQTNQHFGYPLGWSPGMGVHWS